jgi:hypothetical protein
MTHFKRNRNKEDVVAKIQLSKYIGKYTRYFHNLIMFLFEYEENLKSGQRYPGKHRRDKLCT